MNWCSNIVATAPNINWELMLRNNRVIVYLTVNWSAPERMSRTRFAELAEHFAHSNSIQFFVADEDDSQVRQRFASKYCDRKCPRGAGAILWLEDGRVLVGVLSAASMSCEELVQITESTWLA
jgi:hypothetical protein